MSETPAVPVDEPTPVEPQTVDMPEEPQPVQVDLDGETLYDGDVEDTAADEEGEPPQPAHTEVYDEGEDELEEPDFDTDEEDQA